MDFVVGIDGGGTKTSVILADLNGKEIASRTFGPSNINSIGLEAFKDVLDKILSYIEEFGNCVSLCMGISGVSNQIMVDAVKSVFSNSTVNGFSLVGDHIIALEGAHEGNSGIAVIAGTGSICFGKNSDGIVERTGGWGHLIGDDGSAYGIGRDIFSACVKYYDGYGKKTILLDFLSKELGLQKREQIIEYVYRHDKSKVAAVSKLIDKAYELNDNVAIEIIKKNALELANATVGVAQKLSLYKADVALLGGMIEKDTPFRKEFIQTLSILNENLTCIKPKRSAAYGAVMIALKNLAKESKK